ncbi:hypothetical protein TNCV_3874771 [Trichonephila clavipes]|nr:hypothetical protein TNCV_3874771 [Trichonephila clavipes]
MVDESSGAIRFQTGWECNCTFRTNRILMMPRVVGRVWWLANKKGRRACCGSTLAFKRVFRRREESPGKKLERPEEREGDLRVQTSKKKVQILDFPDDERW